MKLPKKLLEQFEQMSEKEQEEVIHHLSILIEAQRRQQTPSTNQAGASR